MTAPLIVSASYRTDIPAFYAAWFENRLRAGDCRVRNPYGGKPYTVRLDAEGAAGFVFWTRNPGPFLPVLDGLAANGRPFLVQMTITGYPRALETSVIAADRSVALARRIAETYGPRALVWRYDPIVATPLTPPETHADRFARLADGLAGATDEVVVSFASLYRKTVRNLGRARIAHEDPPAEAKRALLERLAGIARDRDMALSVCSQAELAAPGTRPARCIDAERLSDVAGRPIAASTKGNRPGCECAASRDIGAYDTCPHGCVYCYAVSARSRARTAHAAHDPTSDSLG